MGSATGEGTGADGEGPDALSEELADRVDGGQRMLVTGERPRMRWGKYVQSDQGRAVRRTGPAAHPCRVSDDEPAQQLLSGDLWHRDGDRGLQESVRPHLRRRRSRYGTFQGGSWCGAAARLSGGGLPPGRSDGHLSHGAAAGAESPLYKQLLRELGAEDTLAFEEAAMEAYEARLAEFRDEKRSYLY